MSTVKFKGKPPEVIKATIAAGTGDTFFDSGSDYDAVWFDSTSIQEIYGDQIFFDVTNNKNLIVLDQVISGTCLDTMEDFINV